MHVKVKTNSDDRGFYCILFKFYDDLDLISLLKVYAVTLLRLIIRTDQTELHADEHIPGLQRRRSDTNRTPREELSASIYQDIFVENQMALTGGIRTAEEDGETKAKSTMEVDAVAELSKERCRAVLGRIRSPPLCAKLTESCKRTLQRLATSELDFLLSLSSSSSSSLRFKASVSCFHAVLRYLKFFIQ